ncbi:hypothetical protein WUBG_00686 [Wuchereria bancrofti]|uniref:Uncharacterized protein n=1 Tax=Wuchereria bancrofti TaxID=6293 RepID=J9F0J8_WUCBA|nr:hypothetical protein WUBG_00686 [Wuchereria bancrofti]
MIEECEEQDRWREREIQRNVQERNEKYKAQKIFKNEPGWKKKMEKNSLRVISFGAARQHKKTAAAVANHQELSCAETSYSRYTKVLAPKVGSKKIQFLEAEEKDVKKLHERTHPAETRRQRETSKTDAAQWRCKLKRDERKACYEVYPLSSLSASFYHPTNERTVWEVLLHHPFTEICIAFMLVPMSMLALALNSTTSYGNSFQLHNLRRIEEVSSKIKFFCNLLDKLSMNFKAED